MGVTAFVEMHVAVLQGPDEPMVLIYAWWGGEFTIMALKPASEFLLDEGV